MGYESRVRKNRKCRACTKVMHISAIELRDHAGLCARAKSINLVLMPSIVQSQPGDMAKIDKSNLFGKLARG